MTTNLDGVVRALCQSADYDQATRRILGELGPEIFGFLCAVQSREADAKDAFSLFSEQLWRSLPKFQGSCSVRSWAYLLARHASTDVARENAVGRRAVPLSFAGEIEAAVRTATGSWLRSERAERMRQLRSQLAAEDQIILVLRIDRDLSWNDVARTFLAVDPEPSDKDLQREAARVRKRYESLVGRLRRLGEAEGLIQDDEGRS